MMHKQLEKNLDINKSEWKQDKYGYTVLWHLNVPKKIKGFPGSSVSKESACSAGDLGSIPESGRSSGEGNGYLLWYSCLENPMDRESWQAILQGVTIVGHDLVTKPPPPKKIKWKSISNIEVLKSNQISYSDIFYSPFRHKC